MLYKIWPSQELIRTPPSEKKIYNLHASNLHANNIVLLRYDANIAFMNYRMKIVFMSYARSMPGAFINDAFHQIILGKPL